MDAEDLGREMDKLEEQQRGKGVVINMEEVEKDVARLENVGRSGNITEAVEGLLSIEKRGRLAEDPSSTKLACCSLLGLLHERKDYKGLQEKLVLLAKRRGQLKEVVKAMVRQSMEYVDEEGAGVALDRKTKEDVIKTLQSITEGKIYVEIERARITRHLAKMKEEDGDVNEAANILQEVAVETFGSMSKVEKIAYILEQVRLCLEKEDYIRAQILSRKVSPRAFVARAVSKKGESSGEIGIEGTSIEPPAKGTPTLEELKIQYYTLMIKYFTYEKNYLEVCRSYRAILDTPSVAAAPAAWESALKHAAWYAVLAPRGPDQITLLTTTKEDGRLDSLPLYQSLLNQFSKDEILWWNMLSQEFGEEIEGQQDIFGAEGGDERRKAWRLRVVEHNIYTISKFYSKIGMGRLADILELSPDEAEERLCDMVSDRGLALKVDRTSGTVTFGSAVSKSDVLNTWHNKIGSVLHLVEKTCQQIQKESQIHKVPIDA